MGADRTDEGEDARTEATQRDTRARAARWTSADPVHYVDFGGPDDAPTVVLVHGLGGSHLNWDLFAPLLRPHARVLALDLPGFGRSEPGDRRTTVQDNVQVLDRFLREVAGDARRAGRQLDGRDDLDPADRGLARRR